MIARDSQAPLHRKLPRVGLWRDMGRDWRRWSRTERMTAPLLLGGMIAATLPVLWLIAQ